ncbi:MAG: hypothetical protein M1819_004349 [Sarea resinae]|nr:MAG: hypothetical protein M1819_004349 [Sarea resinae]
MSIPRLTFLYPSLFRTARIGESLAAASHQPAKASQYRATPRAGFHCTPRRKQQATARQRYGPASEPTPPPTGRGMGDAEKAPLKDAKEVKGDGQSNKSPQGPEQQKAQESSTSPFGQDDPANNTDEYDDNSLESDAPKPEEQPQRVEQESAPPPPKEDLPPTTEAMGTVLHMGPPSSIPEDRKPPHLQATPYVHHFDTYSLVRRLAEGGFTEASSVTIMKAVRDLLTLNLEKAQKGLVSKSDVENETYLFRAACSELRTEIQNNRKAETEKMRTERTQLQHEVDILNQKLTQDMLTLKEALKGMFNDRKMVVNTEQRGMATRIQELNYKITVALNSDSKSEVEGLRWVLTRRAAITIISMAFMILSSLRYHSYVAERAKKAASASSSDSGGSGSALSASLTPSSAISASLAGSNSSGGGGDSSDGGNGGASNNGGGGAGMAAGPDAVELIAGLNQGVNPGYVSLG